MIDLLISPYGYIHRMGFIMGHILLAVVTICIMFGFFYIIPQYSGVFGVPSADFVQALDSVLAAISNKVQGNGLMHMPAWDKATGFIYISGVLILAFIAWSNICLIIKRLRDLDVSLWFALIPTAVLFYAIELILALSKTLPEQSIQTVGQVFYAIQILSYIILVLYPSRITDGNDDDEDDD